MAGCHPLDLRPGPMGVDRLRCRGRHKAVASRTHHHCLRGRRRRRQPQDARAVQLLEQQPPAVVAERIPGDGCADRSIDEHGSWCMCGRQRSQPRRAVLSWPRQRLPGCPPSSSRPHRRRRPGRSAMPAAPYPPRRPCESSERSRIRSGWESRRGRSGGSRRAAPRAGSCRFRRQPDPRRACAGSGSPRRSMREASRRPCRATPPVRSQGQRRSRLPQASRLPGMRTSRDADGSRPPATCVPRRHRWDAELPWW